MQKRQRGQSLSEYLLILGLIAVTSIAVVGTLGSTIRSQVATMTQELAGRDSSASEGGRWSSTLRYPIRAKWLAWMVMRTGGVPCLIYRPNLASCSLLLAKCKERHV